MAVLSGKASRLLLVAVSVLCHAGLGFQHARLPWTQRPFCAHHATRELSVRLAARAQQHPRLLAAAAAKSFYLEDPITHNLTCPTAFTREALRDYAETKSQPADRQAMLASMLDSVLSNTQARDYSKDPLFDVIDRRLPVPVSQSLPGVYLLGLASIEAFANLAWFIRRPGGNVMVDVPQYDDSTADALAKMGGVQMLMVTHEDSVGDHAKWLQRFPDCKCIAHRFEGIRPVHYRLEREGPWHVAEDLQIFAKPGHTAGSIAVLFHSGVESALFSGDQIVLPLNRLAHPTPLWGSLENRMSPGVHANAIRALAQQNFTWLLPGHGKPIRTETPVAMRQRLEHIAFQLDNGVGLEPVPEGDGEEIDFEALFKAPPDYGPNDFFDPEIEGDARNKTEPAADEPTNEIIFRPYQDGFAPNPSLFENTKIERMSAGNGDGPISFH